MKQEREAREVLESLAEISPYDFEKFVAELWHAQGYETEVLPESGDMGIDVVAIQEEPIKHKVAIQVKRYDPDRNIHRDEVQKYHSLKHMDRDTDSVMIVTTGGFSDGAWRYARENNIQTVDGNELVDRIERYKAESIVKQYTGRTTTASEPAEVKTFGEIVDEVSQEDGVTILDAFSQSVIPTLFVGMIVWFGAVYALFELSGFTYELAFWVVFALHLILPAFVFKDARVVHRSDSSYRPNRILWPTFTLFFGGIAVGIYLFQRGTSLK